MRIGNDGQPGLRVRRGLGTSNEDEARKLVDQLNVILFDQSYWAPTLRQNAEQKFDSRIVAAFYDDLAPALKDTWTKRDEFLPIPGPEVGYTRALLIGTTGAGKTTLVRQLIGTSPNYEKFPSTSVDRTTICDIEVILSSGLYKAIVTFVTEERLRQYVEECVSTAVSSQFESRNFKEIERKFSGDSRFRLSYLLGTLNSTATGNQENKLSGDEIDNEETATIELENSEISLQERELLHLQLKRYIEQIRVLSENMLSEYCSTLGFDRETANKEETEAFYEILEDELCKNELFHQLVDDIIDDIESRFEFVTTGKIIKERGWPSYWTFESNDRREFIKIINKFSGNYPPNFGRLLTPLVDGIRVSGPFQPAWYDGSLKLVLMDGEGLGHISETTSSLSTSITKKYSVADAVVLVDKAKQSMLAAPLAALKSLVASGHESKLILCFTHFDQVIADNLPDLESRKDHVLTSVENAIQAIGKEVSRRAERALRRTLSDQVIFLSNIQKIISEKKGSTKSELTKLIESLISKIKPKDVSEVKLYYDDANLVLSIQKALQDFHEPWRAKLGLVYHPSIKKEHWSRIKALTRRYGFKYDNLEPVADLILALSRHFLNFIDRPLQIEPVTSPEEFKSEAIANIAREISKGLHEFIPEILLRNKEKDWIEAYTNYSGRGSSELRARKIRDIYDSSVPIPQEIPSVDANKFLSDIRLLIEKGVEAGGGKFVRPFSVKS
jgi:predicted GTPase